MKYFTWKNVSVLIAATVIPGGFVALGIYGIKKLLEQRRKGESVQTKRP